MPDRSRVENLGSGLLGVWGAFAGKDALKRLPGARWHPAWRCWVVPACWRRDVDAIVADLNRGGDGTRRPWQPSAPPPAGDLDAALMALFRCVPAELRKPLFRCVVRCLHPDHGGSDEMARSAIAAWRRSQPVAA